ncbi:hypothetical protein Slin15195_G118070 [Septoria linicola]|uniref:Uncharacterized protein n=1 Tax=Septoria linicola TaxID=215465 RepID=A0A9Q9ERE6_9PEZI|nr:hypothetical protein Slin14017_G095070 [Septoria linicola]USW58488.1 hypothetical protein Slin15195_G118070 [Septoria linicola]
MSSIQIESLDVQHKHAFRDYRRILAPVAVLAGTTLLGLIVLSGVFHLQGLTIASPLSTAVLIRPEYPVSTFIYERGAFSWFIGVALAVGGGGLAFTGVGLSCVAVTGATLIAGCVVAAVAAAITVASTLQSAAQSRQLRLAQQAMVYMDYADKSAKRSTDLVDEHRDFIHSVFGSGSNYQSAGHITPADKNNGHLVAKNNGSHVPVFSFTTPQGTQFHHIMIEDGESGGKFHRFGSNNATQHTKRASTDSIGSIEEYFTSGGIDVLDCGAGASNHLNDNDTDNDNMQSELQCAAPNLENASEIAVQVYDATTQETIAGIKVAPYDPSGDSVLIDDSDYSSCPTSLTAGDTCPQESDSG